MRKIETETVYPFLAGGDASGSNCESRGRSYFLHGNLIAQRLGTGVIFHHAGWNSRTTGSRLRAIVRAMDREGVYVCQKDHSLGIEGPFGRVEFDEGPVFLGFSPHSMDGRRMPFQFDSVGSR